MNRSLVGKEWTLRLDKMPASIALWPTGGFALGACAGRLALSCMDGSCMWEMGERENSNNAQKKGSLPSMLLINLCLTHAHGLRHVHQARE